MPAMAVMTIPMNIPAARIMMMIFPTLLLVGLIGLISGSTWTGLGRFLLLGIVFTSFDFLTCFIILQKKPKRKFFLSLPTENDD